MTRKISTGFCTHGEELPDADLLLSDVDLLSAEQALDFIEDDAKEGCDCSDISARGQSTRRFSC